MLHAAQKNCLAVVRKTTQRHCGYNHVIENLSQFLHIHYLTDIDLDKVVDLFAKMHPRRLELGTLLKDRDDQQPAEWEQYGFTTLFLFLFIFK